MTHERTINRVSTVPPVGPGFGGPSHTATPVIEPGNFAATDPFFLMMEDRISRSGPFGGEHPHAGLETVTFMLDGTMDDLGGNLHVGDVEWMTAGAGIVHAEETVVSEDMRLLQLWVVLPQDKRQIAPRVQILACDRMPVREGPGAQARVYSGRSGEIEAATVNAVPVTLVDIRLEPGACFEQDVPASYNGFILVLEGLVLAGAASTSVSAGQVGWSNPVAASGASGLVLRAGEKGTRILFCAGQPQNSEIAARGPFLAGSEAELNGYFSAYRQGRFPRASSMRTAHV